MKNDIKKFVKYDPETGLFQRIARLSWKGNYIPIKPFEPTSITPYGYRQMSMFGRPHHVHRLIFLYMEGEFPAEDVDHINGDRLDNRWCNLRKVDRQTNLRNIGLKSNNTSGHAGVSFRNDTGKYTAYIFHKNKKRSLGSYSTIEDAIKVRIAAEKELNFHPNHGRRAAWQN